MVTWSSFYPYILPETPGVPEPLLDHVVRKAAIEFCEETALHTIDATPVDVVANTSTYAINTGSTELDVCMVKFAWFNDRPLPYISQETLNTETGAYWPSQTAEQPTGFTQQDQDNFMLYPVPTQSYTGAVKMKLVVRPSLTATGLTDWVAKRFIQEIAYGAIAMLTGMVGKPWSNDVAEAKYRALFESAKTKATIDAYRSFTRSALQIGLPRFG